LVSSWGSRHCSLGVNCAKLARGDRERRGKPTWLSRGQ